MRCDAPPPSLRTIGAIPCRGVAKMTETAGRRVSFHEVLAIREFRALYLAQTLSAVGDQLARIAVAVLVFDRTGSSTLTAVSYAVSYLPWLIGGPTLSVFADRLPHRSVMLACDSGRSALVCLIALPGCPTVCVIGLVALVALLQPPFTSARAALIPEIVGEGESYTAASTLTNTTLQMAVLTGFGLGGALVASLGTSATVVIDGLTFVASTCVIARFVARRPATAGPTSSWRSELSVGWTVVFASQHLRRLVGSSWILVGTVIVTEAIAVPYAHAHNEGAIAAGFLTASMPLGTAIGALVLGRAIDAKTAERAMPILAFLTPAVLALTATNPAPTIVAIDWFCAGALSAVTVTANRIFVVSVPREVRGRAFGVAAAGIAGAQGIGTLVVGLTASRLSPAHAVGTACVAAFLLMPLAYLPRSGPARKTTRDKTCSRLIPSRSADCGATPSCDLPAS